MSTKNTQNDIPDFSAVFDIDGESLPKELIEKDPDSSSKNLGFLSEKDDEEEEKKKDEKKKEIKTKKADKRKNRTIAVLAGIIFLFVGIFAASVAIRESRKPVITAEKPVIQTISRYTQSNAVTIAAGSSIRVFFIDNDYDVHYIEVGQTVELSDADANTYTGTITDIAELAPDFLYVESYAQQLTGTTPSTAVYGVFVTPHDSAAFSKAGVFLTAKTLTKTADDAITVPAGAVFIDGNQPYVWLYSPIKKSLFRQDVKTGLTVDGITQIVSGIEKSDRVAVIFSCSEDGIYDGIKVKTD